jgi:hypothetical protein
MNVLIVGLIGIAVFFGLIMLRMPIAFAMALVGFAGFGILTSVPASLDMVAKEIYNTFTSYSLSVIAFLSGWVFWHIIRELVQIYISWLIS